MAGKSRVGEKEEEDRSIHLGSLWRHISISNPESNHSRSFLARSSCMSTNSYSTEACDFTNRKRRSQRSRLRRRRRRCAAGNSRGRISSVFETHGGSHLALSQLSFPPLQKIALMTCRCAVGRTQAFRTRHILPLMWVIDLLFVKLCRFLYRVNFVNPVSVTY